MVGVSWFVLVWVIADPVFRLACLLGCLVCFGRFDSPFVGCIILVVVCIWLPFWVVVGCLFVLLAVCRVCGWLRVVFVY